MTMAEFWRNTQRVTTHTTLELQHRHYQLPSPSNTHTHKTQLKLFRKLLLGRRVRSAIKIQRMYRDSVIMQWTRRRARARNKAAAAIQSIVRGVLTRRRIARRRAREAAALKRLLEKATRESSQAADNNTNNNNTNTSASDRANHVHTSGLLAKLRLAATTSYAVKRAPQVTRQEQQAKGRQLLSKLESEAATSPVGVRPTPAARARAAAAAAGLTQKESIAKPSFNMSRQAAVAAGATTTSRRLELRASLAAAAAGRSIRKTLLWPFRGKARRRAGAQALQVRIWPGVATRVVECSSPNLGVPPHRDSGEGIAYERTCEL